jgi:hypothetical protein
MSICHRARSRAAPCGAVQGSTVQSSTSDLFEHGSNRSNGSIACAVPNVMTLNLLRKEISPMEEGVNHIVETGNSKKRTRLTVQAFKRSTSDLSEDGSIFRKHSSKRHTAKDRS